MVSQRKLILPFLGLLLGWILGGSTSALAVDRAFIASKHLWKTNQIPVCFENPHSTNAEGREITQKAVTDTWQRYSSLEFTGWGKCQTGDKGIRILIEDGHPHTKGLGIQLKGSPNGMSLNFTFDNFSPTCKSRLEYCIRVIAIHEFGHALSFAHEQNRKDTPKWCGGEQRQGTGGDITVGDWDLHSVMNYCNPKWSGNGVLSAYDIEALQRFYGKPENKKEMAVELSVNQLRKSASFHAGDLVEFAYKTNQPGWVYFVGIVKNEKQDVKYLLNVAPEGEEPRYLAKVEREQVGKWIQLGLFEVAPPYGEESIMVVGSTSELKLPEYEEDENGLARILEQMTPRSFHKQALRQNAASSLISIETSE